MHKRKKRVTLENWEPPAEQVRAHHKRHSANRRAAAVPLPGPLREAFADFPKRIQVGAATFKMMPITGGHIAILQQINSPFLQAVRMAVVMSGTDEAAKKEAEKEAESISNSIADIAELVFIFTRNARETRAVLEKGRTALRKKAEDILDNAPASADWTEIQRLLGEHYALSFATSIQYEADEGGEKNFSAPARSKTDSAGCSR